MILFAFEKFYKIKLLTPIYKTSRLLLWCGLKVAELTGK